MLPGMLVRGEITTLGGELYACGKLTQLLMLVFPGTVNVAVPDCVLFERFVTDELNEDTDSCKSPTAVSIISKLLFRSATLTKSVPAGLIRFIFGVVVDMSNTFR